jgi:Pyruvate/2-oxoacid:ferredoxin oxidoreductase delta subunit
MLRKIVRIDEARCDGCGECLTSCAEGAIALVGGKARLVGDVYCDGLGACLGECPQGAISVVEREAAPFDEAAVAAHLALGGRAQGGPSQASGHAASHPGCPGSAPRELRRPSLAVLRNQPGPAPTPPPRQGGSALGTWPIQLRLVSPEAPWLAGANLLVAADCVPFAYADFHAGLLAGHALVIACPKLDDQRANVEKLTALFARGDLRSITVARMEVPCCGGLSMAVRQAVERAGAALTVQDVVIGIDGALRAG